MYDLSPYERGILIRLLQNRINGFYREMPSGSSLKCVGIRNSLKLKVADLEELKRKLGG